MHPSGRDGTGKDADGDRADLHGIDAIAVVDAAGAQRGGDVSLVAGG